MNGDIKKLMNKLTLEEKASLCCGEGFWNTSALPQYDIPALTMTDGPHGIRRQTGRSDHLGLNESQRTTCFPTAAGMASSWNPELIHEIGMAIGEECQEENVQIILGPGANIKRSPLCGRNFEYFSEDPYLTGKMAARQIKGIQSKGIGTSLKHFAVNNQETRRFNIDVNIDERTLREIYLAGFEAAVKEAEPWTVMSAYNKINGEFCSQNKKLLHDILREEWGFDGFVVTDWFAVSERDKGLLAGLDLEMPTSAGIGKQKILTAIQNGTISEEMLDKAVERILNITQKTLSGRKSGAVYDKDAHHALARKAAAESMALLKNKDAILPLSKTAKIAVFGEFAVKPRFQGAGSSKINPTKIDIPFEEMKKTAKAAEIVFFAAEDAAKASDYDVCVIFAGLYDSMDAEGKDRKDLRLPDEQNALISQIAKFQPNTVVILANGSALEMPWIDEVKGVLEAYLGGQAMGGAVSDILFGDVNPSGKLAETFPKRLQDTPCYLNFPGEKEKVEYREGIFVGYRYYDKAEVEPLFPFGYGLSYTSFAYSDLHLDKREIQDTDTVTVTVKIRNTGSRAGKEIVQLYVRDIESSVLRPVKELKGFQKLALAPGEEKETSFVLDKRSFAYYNTGIKDWHVESGEFEIIIAKSSSDIVASDKITVGSTVKLPKHFTIDSTLADIKNEPAAQGLLQMMAGMTSGGTDLGMDVDSVLASIKVQSLVAMSQGKMTMENLEQLLGALNA
jgi:beta-glucosidase